MERTDTTAAPLRLLRVDAVSSLTGLTPRSIANKIAEGRFPRAVLLDARQQAWVEAEVLAWIAERILDRDTGLLPAGRLAVLKARRRGGARRAAAAKGSAE